MAIMVRLQEPIIAMKCGRKRVARVIQKDLFERADPQGGPRPAPAPTAPGAIKNGHGVTVDDNDLPPELRGSAQ